MATLPRLFPQLPDGVASTMSAPVGASTYTAALQTNDGDTSYVTPGLDSAGSLTVNIDDMPVDFSSMDTLSVTAVVRLNGLRVDDSTTLFIQVQTAGGVALTNEVQIADALLGAVYTNQTANLTVNATGLAATKADWDAAMVRLRWTFTKNMASDGIALRVTQVYVDGNYTASAAPAQVTGLTVVPSTTEDPSDALDLAWSAATGASTYEIERDGVVVNTGLTVLNFTDTGLAPATTYTYRVRAVNSNGAGAWSAAVSGTTSAVTARGLLTFAQFAAPEPAGQSITIGVAAVFETTNASTVRVSAVLVASPPASETETAGAVVPTSPGPSQGVAVGVVLELETLVGIEVVAEGPPVVVAVGVVSESEAANAIVSFGTPQGLVVTAVSDTELDLSWGAITGAFAYDIERDGTIIVTNHAPTSYRDRGLTRNMTYTYRVRAVR